MLQRLTITRVYKDALGTLLIQNGTTDGWQW